MSRTAKIWLIVAGILVVLGPILIVLAVTANGGLNLFNPAKYETVTQEIASTFDQIAVDTDITDIVVANATADEMPCRISVVSPEQIQHTAEVQDGKLVIRSTDTRKWYERIFSSLQTPKLIMYLPEQEYSSLRIDTDTGNVLLPSGVIFDTLTVNGGTGDVGCASDVTNDLSIRLSTGDVSLSNINADNAEVETSTGCIFFSSVLTKGNVSLSTDTGDISLKDTVADKSIQIKSSTGDVDFDDCDAADLTIKTSTGDVSGFLLSDKIFITDTSTGDVKVPQTTSGGKCEITTSTGDIQIAIKAK